MRKFIDYLDKKCFPEYQDNWDDKLFREIILDFLDKSHVMLDIGAGAGIVKHMNFKGEVRKVIGIDPDPRVVDNPYLDEGFQGFGDKLPFEDNQFDVIISDNVLEHLDNPKAVFSEVYRVLRPGGVFFFKTPNKYHYMPLISMLTPTWFHRYYNRKRGRDESDTFPTRYMVNSRDAINKLAKKVGFASCNLMIIEGRPEYMRLFSATYIIGLIYERLVNSSKIFEKFRILIIGSVTKPE